MKKHVSKFFFSDRSIIILLIITLITCSVSLGLRAYLQNSRYWRYTPYLKYIIFGMFMLVIILTIIQRYFLFIQEKEKRSFLGKIEDKLANKKFKFYQKIIIFLGIFLSVISNYYFLYITGLILFAIGIIFSVINMHHTNNIAKAINRKCNKCNTNKIISVENLKYSSLYRILALLTIVISIGCVLHVLNLEPPKNLQNNQNNYFLIFLLPTLIVFFPLAPFIIILFLLPSDPYVAKEFILIFLFTTTILGYQVYARKNWHFSCSECKIECTF